MLDGLYINNEAPSFDGSADGVQDFFKALGGKNQPTGTTEEGATTTAETANLGSKGISGDASSSSSQSSSVTIDKQQQQQQQSDGDTATIHPTPIQQATSGGPVLSSEMKAVWTIILMASILLLRV